ncbi:hypothetical protein [Comamonas thiooxydans]|uniref:hypothetical protein n=1 Tax=Comamonas thiooxydans TaxID=363952 RepID=UPI001CCBC613|nr:hypothetical protein [Comamonas thiooxydans]UBQ44615.1 hypothetical protein LCH15_26035 [Comamonas thiooxydans]
MLDRPIVVHRVLVDLGVGITGAVLLSQALYWTQRTTDRAGWFYKTIDEWQEETGLTRAEQKTARARLETAGLMREELRGVPARMYFQVQTEALSGALLALPSGLRGLRIQGCEEDANKPAGIQQAGGSDAAARGAGKLQTKVKASTTAKTTTTTTACGAATKTGTAGTSLVKVVKGQAIVIKRADGREMTLPGDMRYPRDAAKPSFKVWANYAYAFNKRYGVWPVFNARQAKMCTNLVGYVGEEDAPKLVAYYVGQDSDRYVLEHKHKLSLLVQDAETWLARAKGAKGGQPQHQAEDAAMEATVAAAMALRQGTV